MNYVYVAEFIELPRVGGHGGTIESPCEHGNAIFSRFPIGNVGFFRHTDNRQYYTPPDAPEPAEEPRLGGRVALFADVEIGDAYLHVVSIHYEPNPFFEEDTLNQAIETAEHGLAQSIPVVIGGDTNNATYFLDASNGMTSDFVMNAFFDRGYVDAHASLPVYERGTRGDQILDVLVGTDALFSSPGVCRDAVCGEEASDHRAVWATVGF